MDKNKRAMQREMSQLCKSMIGFAASKKFIFFYIHIHIKEGDNAKSLSNSYFKCFLDFKIHIQNNNIFLILLDYPASINLEFFYSISSI
jgi:hypothetical protein